MSSDKKFYSAVLAVLVLATVGCSRNKHAAAPAPVATGYAAPQPVVAAPAPVAHRSSTYIK